MRARKKKDRLTGWNPRRGRNQTVDGLKRPLEQRRLDRTEIIGFRRVTFFFALLLLQSPPPSKYCYWIYISPEANKTSVVGFNGYGDIALWGWFFFFEKKRIESSLYLRGYIAARKFNDFRKFFLIVKLKKYIWHALLILQEKYSFYFSWFKI